MSTAEAKERFRDAAARVSLRHVVARHPYQSTFVALTAGLVAGGARKAPEHLASVLMAALPGLLFRR
ncbi:MAG TPA: hypothetical protein ENK05_08970 [Gammaproteobacteria bacterium]|nr:hypothetical protein [Gammaproteobacteria bacterium]